MRHSNEERNDKILNIDKFKNPYKLRFYSHNLIHILMALGVVGSMLMSSKSIKPKEVAVCSVTQPADTLSPTPTAETNEVTLGRYGSKSIPEYRCIQELNAIAFTDVDGYGSVEENMRTPFKFKNQGTENLESMNTPEPTKTPEPEVLNYIELSKQQIRDLAALIYLEAGAESYECQKAVASVVINRMIVENKTFKQIVYAKGQFSTARKIDSTKPSESCMKAAKEIVKNGPSIPKWVTFFREGHYFDWGDRYGNYKRIDKTYFSYDKEIRNKLEGED